jgi:hypothetical protein
LQPARCYPFKATLLSIATATQELTYALKCTAVDQLPQVGGVNQLGSVDGFEGWRWGSIRAQEAVLDFVGFRACPIRVGCQATKRVAVLKVAAERLVAVDTVVCKEVTCCKVCSYIQGNRIRATAVLL